MFRFYCPEKCWCALVICAVLFMAHCGPAAQTSASVEQRVESLLRQMTVEEKIDYIGGDRSFYIRAIPRLGIPEIKMSDGPTGVRNYGPSTAYPAGICLAATWNVDLATSYGAAIAHDCRARGVHIWLAPGMNIYRAPMCGRNFEYFGEDPWLASRMVVPLVKQVQAGGVLATIKHFAANNQEYDRHNVSSDVDERTLREIYLPAFRAGVQEGGAACVMDAYNLLNGTWCTANRFLNIDFLKNECGFDGIVMSDWGAVHDTVSVANGGMDLEMPSGKYLNSKSLVPLIESGQVTQATIDDKVRRILRVIVRAGFMDREQKLDRPPDDPASAAAALQIAREGIVLLKNENKVLPLRSGSVRSVAVIGPAAADVVPAGGGSSRTIPFHQTPFLDGIRAQAGGIQISYEQGLTSDLLSLCSTSKYQHTGIDGKSSDGLLAEYFDNRDLKGKPKLTRTDAKIDFDWDKNAPADGLPANNFSARWNGTITPAQSGAHHFVALSDDGLRVWINEQLVLDDWNDHHRHLKRFNRDLESGQSYALRVEYFENKGDAAVQFGWAPVADPRTSAAVELARKSDAAIICVGFGHLLEGEGYDRTFELPEGQDDLIRRVVEVNPHTIVVLASGGNIDMQSWLPKTAAVIQTWYPGQEGGTALGEILFGKVSPSGKLPATFEKSWADNPCHDSYYDNGTKHVKYKEGVFVGYRGYDKSQIEPQFCFGHGLSYSTFEYRDLTVSPTTVTSSSTTAIRFSVTNSGEMEAAESAQVYVHPPKSKEPRPPKELKGFKKVNVKPGESKQLEMELGPEAFAYWDPETKRWQGEPGVYEIQVGASSRDIRLKAKVTLESGK